MNISFLGTTLDSADSINIHGEYLTNLSAHADYAESLKWLAGFERAPKNTFITHGEPVDSDVMRLHIEEQLHWKTTVPDYLEAVHLD